MVDVTNLPNSDDGVGNQNKENDKRFDERCYLVFGLFKPRQYLQSHQWRPCHAIHHSYMSTICDRSTANRSLSIVHQLSYSLKVKS